MPESLNFLKNDFNGMALFLLSLDLILLLEFAISLINAISLLRQLKLKY